MAVIPSIPGLEATIVVNGVTAVEYQDPDAEESHTMARDEFDLREPYEQALPHVVKYIEAKPGARYMFQVAKKYHIRGQNHHIAYSASVDGNNLLPCHQPAHTRRCRKGEWTSTIDSYMSGNPTTGYQYHSFQFAALDIVETGPLSAAALQRQMAVAQQCGTLKIAVFHMRKSELDATPMVAVDLDQNDAKVAEKAVKGKAVDCLTTYTTHQMAPPPPRPFDDYSDDKRRPFAVFEFRYRTKEGLMREGVVPRPGIAEQLQGMSEVELRQRLGQMMEENERSADKIDPGDASDVKGSRGIKREADEMDDGEFMARYKAQRLENGRLEVDFTDD